mgnify:CR=1 FL=1
MRKLSKLLAVGAILTLGLTACGSSQKADTSAESTKADASSAAEESTKAGESSKAEGDTTIKIGVVGENNEQWTPVIDAMAKEGITVELVKFADYSLPNRALNDGEIDLNAFQHKAYLANDVKDNGYKIEAIGDTIVVKDLAQELKVTVADVMKTLIFKEDRRSFRVKGRRYNCNPK